MIHEDNAAGRLWVLLAAVRENVTKYGPARAWAAALELEDAAEARLNTAMADVYGLLLDVKEELQSLKGDFDVDRYASYFTRWARALQTTEMYNDPDKLVSQAAMDMLASASDIIHELGVRSSGNRLDRESADALLAEVTDMISQVLSLEGLDAVFRGFLVQHLQAVEDALRRFRLRGYSEIDAALGKIIGDTMRNPGRWDKFVANPIWERFKSVLSALSLLSQGSQDTLKVIETVSKFGELP